MLQGAVLSSDSFDIGQYRDTYDGLVDLRSGWWVTMDPIWVAVLILALLSIAAASIGIARRAGKFSLRRQGVDNLDQYRRTDYKMMATGGLVAIAVLVPGGFLMKHVFEQRAESNDTTGVLSAMVDQGLQEKYKVTGFDFYFNNDELSSDDRPSLQESLGSVVYPNEDRLTYVTVEQRTPETGLPATIELYVYALEARDDGLHLVQISDDDPATEFYDSPDPEQLLR